MRGIEGEGGNGGRGDKGGIEWRRDEGGDKRMREGSRG